MWFLQVAFIPAYLPTADDVHPPAGGKADDWGSMGKAEVAEAETQTDESLFYAPGGSAKAVAMPGAGGMPVPPMSAPHYTGAGSQALHPQQHQHHEEATPAGGEYAGYAEDAEKGGWK